MEGKVNIYIIYNTFHYPNMEKHIDTPWALKETEGGKFIGCFEEVGFGCSLVDDT